MFCNRTMFFWHVVTSYFHQTPPPPQTFVTVETLDGALVQIPEDQQERFHREQLAEAYRRRHDQQVAEALAVQAEEMARRDAAGITAGTLRKDY